MDDRPTATEWLARFAEALGVAAPDQDTIDTLLDLAGSAAHSSERIAAPIACWLAGTTGTDPKAALAIAHSLSQEH